MTDIPKAAAEWRAKAEDAVQQLNRLCEAVDVMVSDGVRLMTPNARLLEAARAIDAATKPAPPVPAKAPQSTEWLQQIIGMSASIGNGNVGMSGVCADLRYLRDIVLELARLEIERSAP